MGPPALDPDEFLEQLKAEHRVLSWEPLPPDQPRRAPHGDQSRTAASLRYLHGHWALPDSFDPADAGGGVRGRTVGVFGRLTYRVLGRYLREERELLAHMVRVNDALEKRCDELAARCQQLDDDMLTRQAAEAANLAKLAIWLHLEPPGAATAPAAAPNGSAGRATTDGSPPPP